MQWPRPAVLYGMLQKMPTLLRGSKRLEATASMPRRFLTSIISNSLVSYLAALWPLAQSDQKPSTGKQMPVSSVSSPPIFPQPSLSITNHRSTGHEATALSTAPLSAQSENSQQTGFQTEEAAQCKRADAKAMTTPWHHHAKDLFLILGYTFMTAHSTSPSAHHRVLSSRLQTLPISKPYHLKVWRIKSTLKSYGFLLSSHMYLYELVQTFTWAQIIEITTLYIFLFQDLLQWKETTIKTPQ